MRAYVNIYYLRDPRNNYVFYVGATRGALKTRLYAHINDAASESIGWNALYLKRMLIRDILSWNLKPEIKLLKTVTPSQAEKAEKKAFKDFSMRYALLQNTTSFFYGRSISSRLKTQGEFFDVLEQCGIVDLYEYSHF